ncbi:hypothetical protein E6P97_01870 [Patescibacteria group bacterium]|nr:MAG: hypothetical protein E6P97_01870 [Patescibacteria group bacterium]
MANSSSKSLHVRASVPGRTYVGGTFCPEDEALRGRYEAASADVQLRMQDMRRQVQAGGDPSEVLDGKTFRGDLGQALYACLSSIAASTCSLYPLETPNPE